MLSRCDEEKRLARGETIRIGEMGEFALIDRLQRVLQVPSDAQVVKSIGDDCAVLQPSPESELILTTDSQEEGVHYRLDWSMPEEIGWRCLAVNVSDIAAMAGRPLGAVVALSLPPDLDVTFVDGLYSGMQDLAHQMACPIIGGNMTKTTGRVSVTITVLGEVPKGQAIYRSGAQPGDEIWVTGSLGGAKAGLEALLKPDAVRSLPTEYVLACYRRPWPRLPEAQFLRQRATLHSLLDISDGLSGDLRHICEASKVGAQIEAEAVPIHADTRRIAEALEADPLSYALHGGEDFELCFTASPMQIERICADYEQQFNRALVRVGTIHEGKGVTLRYTDGSQESLPARGYDHFRLA
ncbi:thiamine-phosphate kinase [Candidatus Entotheonella serta]|nr:thiamine-phosphate kinase [Candidatus Entotheonella serta]